MNITQLSDHFSLNEATASSTAERLGIDNTQVPPEVLVAMQRTAIRMEKVRIVLGNKPLHIDSWYRCLGLNTALGSKPTSQHVKGEAVDFIAPEFGDCLAIAKCLIAASDLIRFDQLILEHTWIHISFCSPDRSPRNQVLSLLEGGHYSVGLTDKGGVRYE